MELKQRRLWLALGWAFVVLTIYLSLIPNPPEPVSFPGFDKVEHFIIYGALMFWFCQVYSHRRQRVIVASLLVALGVGVEFVQRMTGYRSFEYADMAADTIGVILGWIASRGPFANLFHRIEQIASAGRR